MIFRIVVDRSVPAQNCNGGSAVSSTLSFWNFWNGINRMAREQNVNDDGRGRARAGLKQIFRFLSLSSLLGWELFTG